MAVLAFGAIPAGFSPSLGPPGFSRGWLRSELENSGAPEKLAVARNADQPHTCAMVSLSDAQLRVVMDAAARLEQDRRDTYLQRIGAILRLKGRFDDRDCRRRCSARLCRSFSTKTD
jgi:hypothetical protein